VAPNINHPLGAFDGKPAEADLVGFARANRRLYQQHRPRAAIEPVPVLRPLEPVPYSTTLSAVASKVDGTVSPSCFCGLEVDRELEFGDLIEGDLSRVCAAQDGVSGFELEVVKML
jgi:hypothetical protein